MASLALTRRQKYLAALGVAALVAAGSGIALAAIPDSGDSEFHACVANTGPVRAVYMIDKDASESCATGYTEKVWPGASPAVPHVKVIQKIISVPSSGGDIGDAWLCPTGYTAVSVGWHFQPGSANSDTRFFVEKATVNPDISSPFDDSPREFMMKGHVVPDSTTGQASGDLYARGVCMTEIASDGISTS